MSLDPSIFETIVPSRFITFTIPNPKPTKPYLPDLFLRVAVLDSLTPPPISTTSSPVAAMLVPPYRESDWIFSTQSGHLQLLSSFPQLSRLILIGTPPQSPHPTTYNSDPTSLFESVIRPQVEEKLTPLVFALMPKWDFVTDGPPEIPFLVYEDYVIRSLVVERGNGYRVGQFLVEDVELESDNGSGLFTEFRRRLRFKRMPNLIQTQMRINPNLIENACGGFDLVDLKKSEFRVDTGVLVQPYLTPMIAGLSLISLTLEKKIRKGIKPRVLCLGVGGGSLVGFLNAQLGFEVLGVEADEEVLRVARQYFGLQDGENVRVCVGDAIEFIDKLACVVKNHATDSFSTQNVENDGCLGAVEIDGFNAKFDVIMVDLDSCDPTMGTCAPPLEFVTNSVLRAARSALCELGVLVINVIPQSSSFYETLIREFREVFNELYEIDVGNGENFVLIASASPIGTASSDSDSSFLAKLKLVISGAYIESIKKI